MTTDFVLTIPSSQLKYACSISEYDKQAALAFILLNPDLSRYGKFINAYEVIGIALDCSQPKAKFYYDDLIEQVYPDLDKQCVYYDAEPYTCVSNLIDIIYVLPTQWRVKLLYLKIYSGIADFGLKIKQQNATKVIV